VREFCEDRARILAVVSLPQEAFNAAGATVKASLLFVQKFTDDEANRYAETYDDATAEVDAKYEDEIVAETKRLETEIAEAKKARDADRRKAAQAELKAYKKRMADLKTAEARALLRERFDYPIFLYDAAHVGITATGEPDTCELYDDHNLGLPAGVTEAETALDLYRRFRDDAESFMLDREPAGAIA
jgi:type I restriction enzyme M protein